MEDVKRWAPVAAYAGVMIFLSSQPGSGLPRWSWMAHDKVLHTIEYAGFGFLLAHAFGARRWWWAIVAAVLFGITDEFHQTFVAGRSGNDLGDLGADALGATLGALCRLGLTRLLRRGAADGTKQA